MNESKNNEIVVKIRQNPALWLQTCGTILNRSGELIKPTLNSFQRRVVEVYLWCREQKTPCRIIILKPRRKGSSTISLALAYTHLRNYIGYGAVLGDDLGTTAKLMEVWNRYVENDKFSGWGNTAGINRKSFSHGSKIAEETANDPRAGMAGDIHFLIASEAAHYRSRGKTSGEFVMQSVMNSVPSLPNTCVIMESTPNGANGVFYQTWQGAADFEEFKRGEVKNGYIRVFAPWFEFDDSSLALMPGEQEQIMSNLDCDSAYTGEVSIVQRFGVTADKLKWRRSVIDSPACGRDYKKFLQEYPSDAISCFLQSGQGRFDVEGMDKIESEILVAKEPLMGNLELNHETDPVFVPMQRHESWLRIWEMPKDGMKYIAGADFMTGEQSVGSRKETDCHTLVVLRRSYIDDSNNEHPTKVVAAFFPDDRTKDLDIVALRISLVSKFYRCLVAPEVNNLHGMIELLRRHKTQLWARKKPTTSGKSTLIPGFQTNVQTKKLIISDLATQIREQTFEILCSRTLNELKNFIIHENGSEGAADGHHDDWVMATAIANYVLPAATTYESDAVRMRRESARSAYFLSRHTQESQSLVAEVL